MLSQNVTHPPTYVKALISSVKFQELSHVLKKLESRVVAELNIDAGSRLISGLYFSRNETSAQVSLESFSI